MITSTLSPKARAFHDELWEWLWDKDSFGTIESKKTELREKYGTDAELELNKLWRQCRIEIEK